VLITINGFFIWPTIRLDIWR